MAANNTLEVLVSLGLLGALNLIQLLRDSLNKAVKPDSSAYKAVEDFLNKLNNKADELKGRMGSAFKSSTGSKQFLKLYENLLDGIKTATEKFSGFKLDDLILTDDELLKVDDLRKTIAQLEKDLSNLRKGTIGNLFDDATIKNADKVKDAASKLGLTIENMTFSGLSQAFEKEMNKTSAAITKAEDKVKSLLGLLDALSVNKVTTIRDDIQRAFDAATTGKAFKTDTTDYQTLLRNFYSGFENYLGKRSSTVKAGGDVQEFIKSEIDAITKGCEEMRRLVPLYKLIQQDLLNAFKSNSGNASKTAILDVLKEYKIEDLFKDIDTNLNWTTYWKAIRDRFNEEITNKGLMDEGAISLLLADMITKLTTLFDSVDLDKIIDIRAFRSLVSSILKNSDLNLNDAEIGQITNAIVKGFDLSDILSRTDATLTLYGQRVKLELDDTKTGVDDLKAKNVELAEATKVANSQEVNNKHAEAIELTSAAIEDETHKIHELAQAKQKSNQVPSNSPKDEDSIHRATNAILLHIDALSGLERKQKTLSNVQMAVDRWMGFWLVLNLTKTAINDMKKHIQELDTVMTSISVVTNMSQDDLWGQISQYSEIARQYGVAIKGVYEVSLIYYQLGLESNDVMTLTTETLKMARIAGLDYATAADYMTTAIRGFKLEMQDAGHVTDVFSALAATTASSTEELAVAISKTAASAQAVGASFEATSAMMATMIATTRESATNIGTALKSVISRYGEMTSDPSKIVDSEGEEMSLNRVDKALLTIGITIHDTAGLFRDFDDVMLELMEKWDSLDSLSLRYIATLMAGNRQQSRFLALVSNVDEYKKALQTANDAAGTGDLQTLKTLDSIDAKIERMKVTIQEFYTSSGILDLYKGILDTITNIVSAGNSLPKVFGKIPGLAIAIAGSLISIAKTALLTIINNISTSLKSLSGITANALSQMVLVAELAGSEGGVRFKVAFNKLAEGIGSSLKTSLLSSLPLIFASIGSAISLLGGGLTLAGISKYGASTSADEDRAAGRKTLGGSIVSIIGRVGSSAAMGAAGGAAATGGIGAVPGAIAGGITGLVSGIAENAATFASALNMMNVSLARQIELDKKAAALAQENVTRAKGELKSLEAAYNQLKLLEEARYNSAESELKYIDYMNLLKDSYPSLVESIDLLGNVIITSTTLEELLAKARQKTADATIEAIESELKTENDKKTAYELIVNSASQLNLDFRELGYFLNGRGYDDNDRNSAILSYAWDHNLANIKDSFKTFRPYTLDADADFLYLLTHSADFDFKNSWLQRFPEITQAVVRDMYMTDTNLFHSEDRVSPLRSLIRDIIDNIPKDLELSLDELTNISNFSTDMLASMSSAELVELLEQIGETAAEYITFTNNTLSVYNDTLSRAKTDRDVDTYLNELRSSDDAIQNNLYQKIKDYSSLMSFVLDSKFEQYVDFNTGDDTLYRDELAKWIQEYLPIASRLMEVDYTAYRSMKDFYDDFEGLEGTIADSGWLDQFNKIRTEVTEGLLNLLGKIFGIGNNTVFDNLINNSDSDGELTTLNISYLREGLAHYLSLIKDEQYAAASAYLNSLNKIYQLIGALTSDKLAKIAPIISSLDFTSTESIDTAIKLLTSIGGFDGLVKSLLDASERLMYNVGVMTQRLLASLLETIANIEKAAENAGKGVKYSEAYKTATEILTKYDGKEDLNFNDIYLYNEAVDGYLLTRKGLELLLSLLSAETTKLIENAKELANAMVAFLDSSYFDKYYKNFDFSDAKSRKNQVRSFLQTFGISEFEAEAYLTLMQDIYDSYDGTVDWDKYIEEKRQEYETLVLINDEMFESLLKNSVGASIVSLDYAKIASGEGNHLKDTLAAYLSYIGLDIDNYWNDLLEGRVDSLNLALKNAGVDVLISSSDSKAAAEANAKLYTTLVEELLDDSNTILSDASEALASLLGYKNVKKYPMMVKLLVAQLLANMELMLNSGLISIEDYNNFIKVLAEANNKTALKAKSVADMAKDGDISLEELESYANTYKIALTELYDKETNTLKNETLAAIYTYDPETNTFKAKANTSAEAIMAALAAAFGVSLEGFEDFATETIDTQIALREKDNLGKKIASLLQAISSAKAGDEINVSQLTSEMQSAIGAVDGILTIRSEYLRDNLLLLLESYINGYTGQGREALLSIYKTINDSIISSRGTRSANLGNIILSSISLDDYRKELASRFNLPEIESYSDETIKWFAKTKGYKYDEWSKMLVATEDTLADIDAQIAKAEAPGSGATEQTIRELKLKREALATELNKDYDNEVLIGVLDSYENISELALNAFRAEFGNNYDEYFGIDALGNKFIKDFEGLKTAMGDEYSKIFDEYISTIADSYIDNISKAGSLAVSGTSSQVEILGFLKAFEQLFDGETATFVYDALLDAWVLDTNDMRRMIEKSAEKLTFASETDRQAYILNLLDNLFSENLDFSNFISGTATKKETVTLKGNLRRYFLNKFSGMTSSAGMSIEEYVDQLVDDTLNVISKGGSEAVAKLKEVKSDVTSEELEAAYNAQIAPIQAAAELVDSLEVGSFVATEHVEALTKAGFKIENNVVVSVATSLVEAYKNLYNLMAETGVATTELLNNVGKLILNEQYRSGRGGVDALAAGASMSTDAFIDLWTQLKRLFGNGTDAGVQLKLHELQNKGAISVSETGLVRFKNIDILASELGWNTASEEYKAAYSAWVDATISDNASRDVNTRIKSLISGLASANVGDTVNIHDLSAEMKAVLGVDAGADTFTLLSEVLRDNWILALDASKELNEAVKRAIIESLQAVKSKRNIATNTNAIVAMKVSLQAALDFAIATENESINAELVMRERGYVFNEYTQEWEATAAVLKNLSADLAAARENGTAEDVANLEASYNKLKYELLNLRYNAVSELVSNYTNLSEEAIAAFLTTFSGWGINIRDFISTDEWGRNRVDLSGLNLKLAQVGYDVNELFLQEIAAIGDSYLLNISTGVSLLSSGTNNLSDLGSFVENYNLMLGTNLQIENVSYYDDILQAFTIRPEYIKKYIEAQALALKDLGLIPEELINLWVKDNTIKAALNNIDIGSFLSSDRTQNDINKLGRALETYYATVNRDIGNATKDASYAIKALLAGGERAVNKAREIKPDLTESELAEIYSSAINRWNDALGEVEGIILGQVVTGELRLVLSLLKMVDANGVVNKTFNAVEVYSAIYELMSNTAGATVSDLNNAYAKLLTANDLKRMDAQEALENAADMSFDTLALLYSNYGKNIATILPDLVKSGTVGLTGFGGIRIFDIDAFLGTLGLDASSPEYYELRNEYADAITEFYNNTNNIIDSVAEQIQGLAEIKPGKAVNLSYLESVLPEGLLEKLIGFYGELILNGIYVFNETVDIPKLIQATAEAAAKAGKLIPELMAELADTISGMLADIASLISGGISGSLSNADALKLSSWANLYGVNLLDFTATADGLKLSTNSAKELYLVIKNIDDIQGSIVFDALKESLIETLDEFKTISALSIYMQDLRKKIANTDEYSDEKIKLYEQELALAEEILAARSTTEDDSFKFMDNKIPSGLNNPLNYWSNWYDAFAKMKKTSYKGKDRGKMAYEDFYNIVTEMGNIAAYTKDGINIGGQIVHNSEEAAALIEKGAAALTNMSTGDMGVKLSAIGIDFSSGVDKMATGVDKGIDALADELIDMLDSMIQLLETVVAMEELGDIDIDEDNVLDLGEIFDVKYDPEDSDRIIEILNTYTDKFQIAAKKILDSAKDNEDLTKALDEMKVTVNGQVVTMRLMFEDASDGVKDINIDAEAYTAILNSFYQAYLSGDYNLDHLFESIKSVLAGTGFEGDIDIGDMHLTFTAGTVITWSKDNKAIINGKETQFGKNDTDKIISAMAAAEFGDLLSNNYKIEDSGEVTYHGAYNTSVKIQVKNEEYTATFANGFVSAKSKDELVAAIKIHEMLYPEDFTSTENLGVESNNPIVAFKIQLGASAIVDVKVNTETGEITYEPPLNESLSEESLKLLQDLEEHKEKTLTIVQDVKAKAVADTITDNKDKGKENTVVQDIDTKDNKTEKKIKENVDAGIANPVVLNIENFENETYEALLRNIELANKGVIQKIRTEYETSPSNVYTGIIDTSGGTNSAKGNVALAQGTLMGELGPELYVTGGRYYVAGLNGAEFVNLPDDAIVFNHLLTRSLMNNGHSSRGKAYTSEERALAFATGNWNGGKAMASAASALSSLKQLRAMWRSLQKLTAKDLAGAAGGGGGGGGSKSESNKSFLKDLEKWYNWLQKIAQLETDITYQEQLRSKIQSDMVSHGQDYFLSLLVTLDKLEQSVTTRQDLVNSQEEYFNTRRLELNDLAYPFSSLYEFDEAGQLRYKEGLLANLSLLMGTNQYGEANYTAEEQYNMIVAMDPRFEEYMQYNDKGEKIKWEKDDEGNWKNEDYVTAVENFWNKIEADREEMLSLHDSVEEGKKDILADYESINEILKDIEDNLISLENKIYEALVDSRERAIEELLDTKDAIEDSANKLINGLLEQLNNEKEMYDLLANADELTKLLRQLGILQRSGASAAEIAGLLALITEKLYDAYFDEQLRLIDAILEASDNELEKLQQLIDLETEMLEYEKEYGLLWSQVYDIMHGENAEGIAAYIAKNNSEYWGKSPTEFLKTLREDLFEALAYKDFADRFEGIETLIDHYNNTNVGLGNNAELADLATNTINGTTSTTSDTASTLGSGSGSTTKSVAKGSWKQDNKGWWYENPDGSYKLNEWMQEDGIWYYFDENGYMVTGSRAIDGKNYSFNGSGGLIGENSNTGGNNGNQKGWHLEGVKQVFESETLAKNAREALIQAAATSAEADRWAAAKIKYYSEGGLNDYTGLAMLHGTKSRPEGILNASQTAILRDEILSNKPDSLLSLLTTWRDSVIGLADTSAINNNYTDGVNIEKAEVIMLVSSIANDYDALRAGEQALDKIINVARKTMAQNRIRR